MKKKICKTLRTMANKLPEGRIKHFTSYAQNGDMNHYSVDTNHYRRLKRLLVKGGTQAVKIYYDKHKAI